MTTPKIAYTLAEAAEATSLSFDTIKRAVKATDPRTFPPPLPSYRAGSSGNAKHLVRAEDLDAWVASFPRAS